MPINKVIVVGMGKVGFLVAKLLHISGFEVTGVDANKIMKCQFKTVKGDVSNASFVKKQLKNHDAVISCLPYSLNGLVASVAHKEHLHYFDLTEDVATTEMIRELALTSKKVIAPQCGLAPGFISIVGAHLANKLKHLRCIELRVGALPQHPKGDLGYAFNWSAEGVVNEYLNDCTVISDGKLKTVPSMQDLETIVINGRTLEAFTTSGGLGTMCETYAGKVMRLNYKTMRYPGHMKLMRFYFHELLMKENRELAGKILIKAKPPVNDDIVYVHVAVEGWMSDKKEDSKLVREEFVKAYYPKIIDNEQYRAISWTTASSVVAVLQMVSEGALKQKGFLKQEQIEFDNFLNTKTGKYYAG